MGLLFLHGAGGFDDDRDLAVRLSAALGEQTVTYPAMPDEDMSYGAWADVVTAAVLATGGRDLVVAHSFSASILVRVLAADPDIAVDAALLGMPNSGSGESERRDCQKTSLVHSTDPGDLLAGEVDHSRSMPTLLEWTKRCPSGGPFCGQAAVQALFRDGRSVGPE